LYFRRTDSQPTDLIHRTLNVAVSARIRIVQHVSTRVATHQTAGLSNAHLFAATVFGVGSMRGLVALGSILLLRFCRCRRNFVVGFILPGSALESVLGEATNTFDATSSFLTGIEASTAVVNIGIHIDTSTLATLLRARARFPTRSAVSSIEEEIDAGSFATDRIRCGTGCPTTSTVESIGL